MKASNYTAGLVLVIITTLLIACSGGGGGSGSDGSGSLSGNVLGSPVPVSGAVVTIEGLGLSTTTSAQGFFQIDDIPVGTYTVSINGEEVFDPNDNTVRLPAKAGIAFPDVTISGGSTTPIADRPIFLPQLAQGTAIDTSGGTTATIPAGTRIGNEGLGVFLDFMVITTVTFRDADRTTISITEVPIEETPMALPTGTAAGEIMTIQPPGATFSQPPRVTFPNNDNIPAGTTGVALYRFDHDDAAWVQFDTGTVTVDGNSVVGEGNTAFSGLIETGWNGAVLPTFCTTTAIGRVVEAGTTTGLSGIQLVTVNAATAVSDANGDFTISNVPIPTASFQIVVTASPVTQNSGFDAAVSASVPAVCAGTTNVGDIQLAVVPVDTTPPTVIGVSPTDGATGVPTDSAIQVTFSETISPGSLNASSFTVKLNGTAVTGLIGLNSSVATFLPLVALTENSTYTVTITTDLQDNAGNHLAQTFTSSFTTELTQTPSDSSITVAPADPSIQRGATQQFTAEVIDSAGNPITGARIEWASSDLSVASINNTGLASGVAVGTAIITASVGSLSGSTTLTVTAPSVASVTVTPLTQTLPVGALQSFEAEAKDASGNPIAGVDFTWMSSDPGGADVDAFGTVTAVAAGGPVTITAMAEGVPGTATVTVVDSSAITTITVTPAAAAIEVGGSVQFTAQAKDVSGDVIPGVTFTWTSDLPSVATVNNLGVASGIAQGTVTITASAAGQSGTATLNVAVDTTLVVQVRGRVKVNDPVPGVRILAHDAVTGTLLGDLVTDTNGLADFGDIGATRVSITVVTVETFGTETETDLFTLLNIPVGTINLLGFDETVPAQATFDVTVSGLGSADSGRLLIGDFDEGDDFFAQAIGGSATFLGVEVERLQDDGKFSLLAFGSAFELDGTENITACGSALDLDPAVVSATVAILADTAPVSVPFTADVPIQPDGVIVRRNNAIFDIFGGGSGAEATFGTFQFCDLPGADRYDFIAETSETLTSSGRGVDLISNNIPSSLNFTLPDLFIDSIARDAATQTVTWTASGMDLGDVDAAFVELEWIDGSGNFAFWELITAPGSSGSFTLPGLPADLAGLVPPAQGVGFEAGLFGLDIAFGYDDLLARLNQFGGSFDAFLLTGNRAIFAFKSIGAVVVEVSGSGSGTVVSDPPGINATTAGNFTASFPGGTAVTMTATADGVSSISSFFCPFGGGTNDGTTGTCSFEVHNNLEEVFVTFDSP